MDFYGASALASAEQYLAEREALLESYANEVFEREQNAKPRLAKKPASAKALEGKGDKRTRKG